MDSQMDEIRLFSVNAAPCWIIHASVSQDLFGGKGLKSPLEHFWFRLSAFDRKHLLTSTGRTSAPPSLMSILSVNSLLLLALLS